MRESKSDLVAASFLIALGIVIYLCILGFPPKTQLYPKIVAFLLIGTSFLLLIRSFFSLYIKKGKNEKRLTLGRATVIYFFSANIAYVFCIYFIGFHLASGFYLLGSLYLLGERNFVVGLLFSLMIVAFLYVVFIVFLHVPVPKGIFSLSRI